LKTTSRNRSKAAAALACAVVLAALPFACEEGEDLPTGPEPGAITLDEIIASPKSPTPGDTISLTAVINSSSQNVGDFPALSWSATGGAFIEDNQQTVRWIAPIDTMPDGTPIDGVNRIYTITCKASNDVTPNTTRSIEVFVSDPGVLVASRGGELFLWANETDLYYLRANNVLQGAEIFRYEGGVDSDPVPGGSRNGMRFRLSPDLSDATYMLLGNFQGGTIDPPLNIFIDDLVVGTFTQLTFDRKFIFERRHDQFLFPKFSPDGNLVTFHQMFPAPFVGGVDTFDIDVYNQSTQTTTTVTQTHGLGRHNNFHSSFSSAQDWLVFTSDRGGQNQWELYGLPVVGDQVTTDSSATVQLSVTGGRMLGGITPQDVYLSPRLSAWNGDAGSNVLAWLDGDDILWLFALDSSGAVQTEVLGLGGTPRSLAWSADGQRLVVATATELYISDLAGDAHLVLSKPPGDTPRDPSWSPDGNWLLYRVARAAFTWHELLDVGAGILTEPAVVTSTSSGLELSNYSGLMSIAGVMNSADVLTLLIWPVGQTTPGIVRVDVSGITQPQP